MSSATSLMPRENCLLTELIPLTFICNDTPDSVSSTLPVNNGLWEVQVSCSLEVIRYHFKPVILVWVFALLSSTLWLTPKAYFFGWMMKQNPLWMWLSMLHDLGNWCHIVSHGYYFSFFQKWCFYSSLNL